MENETFALLWKMNRIFILGGKVGGMKRTRKRKRQKIGWYTWNTGHREWSLGGKAGLYIGVSNVEILDSQDGFGENWEALVGRTMLQCPHSNPQNL